MTLVVEENKDMAESQNEKNVLPNDYGCDILFEKTTFDKVKDSSLPNDAYIVEYTFDGEDYIDLVRGSRVNVFDLYYDLYGSGAIQKISFGYGKTNPKLWGIKKTEKKKRK